MIVVGLTGQTGAGKTTASEAAASLGFPVIHADAVAREALSPGSDCLKRVAEAFGEDIIDENGACRRQVLARRAFADREHTELLNRLTHPWIRSRIREYIEQHRSEYDDMVVLDASQLFESGGEEDCDVIVSVTAPKEVRLQRICRRDGISEEAARQRMSAQHDEAFFRERSQFLLDGSLPMEELKTEALDLFSRIHADSLLPTNSSEEAPLPEEKPPGKLKKMFPYRRLLALVFLGEALAATVVLALLLRHGNTHYVGKTYPLQYQAEILDAADKYQVDPALIYGVIKTESDFNPEAQSSAGAIGLMQIVPDSFIWLQTFYTDESYEHYEFEDLWDPALNIDYGTHLLSVLLGMYHDEDTAVCAYNAGVGNVNAWLEDSRYSDDGVTLKEVPFSETENYRFTVARHKSTYQRLYEGLLTDSSAQPEESP